MVFNTKHTENKIKIIIYNISLHLNIEKKLIQQGAQKLTLEVSESNSAAITVYTKLNYKKIKI